MMQWWLYEWNQSINITKAEKETNLAPVSNVESKSETNLNVLINSTGVRTGTCIMFEKISKKEDIHILIKEGV